MRRLRTIFSAAAIAFAVVVPSQAKIISVTKVGGSAEVPALTTLEEGVLAYTDRTHTLVNVPSALIGVGEDAVLAQLSNDDKSAAPLEHQITVQGLSVLYVGLDDRLTSQPLSWMQDPTMTGLPTTFFDTGAKIDIDEGADGTADQSFSLWATIAPSGTYSFLDQNDGGSRNMYFVFSDNKLIPEPASFSLIGLGAIGLLAVRRRK